MAIIPTNDNRPYTILHNYIDKLGVSANRLEQLNDMYAEANITYNSDADKQYTDATCLKMSNSMYVITLRKQLKPYRTQYLYDYEIAQLFV